MQFAFKWAVMTDGEREKGEGRGEGEGNLTGSRRGEERRGGKE